MKNEIKQVKEFYEAFKQDFKKSPENLSVERALLRHSLLLEEVNELYKGMVLKDLNNCIKEVCDCFYILIGTALELGIADKIEEIFKQVHESNMSKLDNEGNPIFREDGKIIKSENYKPVNINIV